MALTGGLGITGLLARPAYADLDAADVATIADDLRVDCVAIVAPPDDNESATVWDQLQEELRGTVENARDDDLDLKVVVYADSPDPAQSVADQVLDSVGGTVLVITQDGAGAASDEVSPGQVQAALAAARSEDDDADELGEDNNDDIDEAQEDLLDEVSVTVDDVQQVARVAALTDAADSATSRFADELDDSSGFSWALLGVQVVGVSLLAGAVTAVAVRRRPNAVQSEGVSGT